MAIQSKLRVKSCGYGVAGSALRINSRRVASPAAESMKTKRRMDDGLDMSNVQSDKALEEKYAYFGTSLLTNRTSLADDGLIGEVLTTVQ